MSSANISAGPLKCLSGEQSDPNHGAHKRKIPKLGPSLQNLARNGCVDISIKVVNVTSHGGG